MKRVEKDLTWSLFCPSIAKQLSYVHGSEFDEMYESFEDNEMAEEVVSARSIWDSIIECQMETGGPFMLYKDAINGELFLHTPWMIA